MLLVRIPLKKSSFATIYKNISKLLRLRCENKGGFFSKTQNFESNKNQSGIYEKRWFYD